MKKASVQKRSLLTREIITKRISTGVSRTVSFIDKRPMASFFAVLGAFLVLIMISNVLTKPKPQDTTTANPIKTVSVYRIGSAPKITVSAQTKKSGVIQIVALSGGVIDKINVQEGSSVKQGDQLVAMSSNYAGGNTLSVQRQISATQYQGTLATYPKQKETIETQKELAEKNQEDAEQLRKITQASIDETKILVSQNEDILKTLNEQLQAAPTLALKQQIAQYQASTNQARQALRSNEYQAGSDNPPADVAQLSKEISKKQLDIQLKQLQINLEVSRLQLEVASLNESLMFPTSPFAGTVQRVLVKEKQQVGQGAALLVLSQVAEDDPITAVAFVSADIAKRVSRIEPSTLHIGDKITYTSMPTFVSTEAVQGSLYAVYYPIPEQYSAKIVSEGFISVDIPIGMADTTMIATYVPLDAVYQTREKAYAFVVSGNLVASRDIQLGQVYGGFVEVLSGLKNGDSVILNRNIIQGDRIQIQ